MSTTFASPADAAAGNHTASPARDVLVWDALVRVGHWLMVASFAGAWLTAESERWRLVHVTLGYTLAGLIVLRLLWGLVGTKHARFASFVRGPAAVMRYLRSLFTRDPEHHVGHNPAGALAILAMLALGVALTASGWATYNELGGDWLEDLHEGAANAMLALVLLHVAAVVASSWLHRENLVAAMIDGHKPARPEDGIARAWNGLAALMLAAVLAFWWWQWQGAPAPAADQPAAVEHKRKHGERDHDD